VFHLGTLLFTSGGPVFQMYKLRTLLYIHTRRSGVPKVSPGNTSIHSGKPGVPNV